MTTTKAYDNLGRLTQLESRETASGAVVVSFGSAYNAANQRTNTVTGPEGAQWRYGYDALGQVTNAWRYWRDGTRVPGQQFAYSFDQIGNRRTAWSGDPGAGLSAVPYQTDIVNQYTVRTNRQSVDIMGLAHASARVTLNGPATTRKGEYYYRAYPTTNSTTASWQRMTITATLTNAGATTNIGWALMPRAQEVMSHDLDGNLTQDGLWTYTWDAENRLARMQSSQMSSNCGAPVMALDFAYDAGGRRMSKTVSCWTNGGWTVLSKLRFVYDGWNLLAELNAGNNGVVRTYAWGTDASGSPQGAGGVGGLLWVTRTADASAHFTCYDGNHNVMALVNAATGETSAQYEYGPFHELLRATGPMARENVFLAATKYQDWETGFYYYGYRYYSPSTGRWLSRDPIEDAGGANYYVCAGNDLLSLIDLLGLKLLMVPTYSEPLATIRGGPGHSTWFAMTGYTDPVAMGEGEFEEKVNGGKFCARIKRAKEISVTVWTAIPSDAVGRALTARGLADVTAHEDRRRAVISKAFSVYLAPVELEGSLATKCGWICCCGRGTAKKKLQAYANDLRGAALYDYRNYVMAEQAAIDTENLHWREDVAGASEALLKTDTIPHSCTH